MPPLWTPSPLRIASTRLTAFGRSVGHPAETADGYAALHRWSVEDAGFWSSVWRFCGVIGEPGDRVVEHPDRLPGARYFPDATINFAENVLRRRDGAVAIHSTVESGAEITITFAELASNVGRAARSLRTAGVRPGDRVAGMLTNTPEAIIAALAAAAVGAVWSSCSPDFGAQGVLDRFGQIEPVVLFAVEGYQYGGKWYDCRAKVAEILRGLPSVRETVMVEGGAGFSPPAEGRLKPAPPAVEARSFSTWLGPDDAELTFERLPFNHPLYILYSSGTTGVPKCLIHGAGGTLVQHLKEHQFHCDIRRDDRVFYFTTCGWMMWNWLVSALASEASIVLYDGSPFHPDGHRLFELADRTGTTLFGTSAKFIDAVRKAGLRPRETHSLRTVRTLTSTGSPLAPESFDFVYEAIAPDVHLASISGGTDIVSCFAGGNPNGPVWRGELQVLALGMDVDVFDDEGHPIAEAAGELVCKRPFPSMPLGFWNDPDDAKYRAAYFEKFPGVWHHGDWVRRTEHDGLIIYGRSDATLNPGGVRIGTAEIYRQVEQLPEIIESLAVGQEWDGDERIVLFVRLAPGANLDAALRQKVSDQIRANTTPRHVPARIVQIGEVPRTKSGKIVELAVRHVIHGRPVKNREALANPEALDLFRDLPELRS